MASNVFSFCRTVPKKLKEQMSLLKEDRPLEYLAPYTVPMGYMTLPVLEFPEQWLYVP